jgi:general secretion pathway protein N
MIERWIFLRDSRLDGRTRLMLVGLFVAALLVLLPLRIVLELADPEARGLSARSVEGQVWSGSIADLKAGPLPLGTVAAGVRPLPLLIGRREIWLERGEGQGVLPFRAIAAGGSDWVRLHAVNGQVPLPDGLGALPVAAIGFGDFTLELNGGRCTAASGTVDLTLSSVSALLPNAVVMSGKARCDKGALYVPMQGPSGLERMALRIESNGNWTADLVLTGLPVEVSGPLLDMGFSARAGGIGIRTSGAL